MFGFLLYFSDTRPFYHNVLNKKDPVKQVLPT